MLDDILEIIAEIVLDRACESAEEKKKAVLNGIAAIVCLVFGGLLLWSGISEPDDTLMFMGTATLVVLGAWLLPKVIHYIVRKRK